MTDSDTAGIGEHLNRPLGRLGIAFSVGVLVAVHAVIWWYANRLVGPLFASLAVLPTGVLSAHFWALSELRHANRELAKMYADIARDLAAKGQPLPPIPPPQPRPLSRLDWIELSLIVGVFSFAAWDLAAGEWEKRFRLTFVAGLLANFIAKAIDIRHPRASRAAGHLTWILIIASLVGFILS